MANANRKAPSLVIEPRVARFGPGRLASNRAVPEPTCGKSALHRRSEPPRVVETLGSFTPRYDIVWSTETLRPQCSPECRGRRTLAREEPPRAM